MKVCADGEELSEEKKEIKPMEKIKMVMTRVRMMIQSFMNY